MKKKELETLKGEMRKTLFPRVLERLADGLLCEPEDLLAEGAKEEFEKELEGLVRYLETVATKRVADALGLPTELSPYATPPFPTAPPKK